MSQPFEFVDDPPPPAADPVVEFQPSRKRSPPDGADKRGGQQETRREPPARSGEPKAPNIGILRAAAENHDDPEGWPKDGFKLWPCIIAWLDKNGMTPAEVIINVRRAPIGTRRVDDDDKSGSGGFVDQGEIRGEWVEGVGGVSPSDALRWYIVSQFHSVGPNGSANGAGPSCYRLDFRYFKNGQRIKEGIVDLDSYATLIRVREQGQKAQEQLRKAREIAESGQPAELPAPTLTAASVPVEAAVNWEREKAELQRELQAAKDKALLEEKIRQVRAEVEPKSASNDAALEWEREKARMQLQAEKDKQALELRIRDMEAKAAQEAAARREEAWAARMEALEAKLRNPGETDEAKLLKHLAALGIIQMVDGKPVPAGSGGAPYAAPAVTPQQQLMEAAKTIAEGQKAGETTREVLRKTFGFVEPTSEVIEHVEPPKPPEPTLIDKALGGLGGMLKGAMQNPEGPLAAIAFVAKGSPLGEMADTLGKAAAAGKAATAASRAAAPPPGGFKSSA